jgi:hypothetical protein
MGNFFNNGPKILKLIVRVRIYHILITSRKKIVALKTGFLRIFFWSFIEVKRTITVYTANSGTPRHSKSCYKST